MIVENKFDMVCMGEVEYDWKKIYEAEDTVSRIL